MAGDIVDSYNGVMLCKRPSFIIKRNSVQNHNEMSSNFNNKSNMSSKEEGSFLCGKVPSPWGSTKVIPEKAKTISRLSRHDGALQRHKRWLKEMQLKREKQLREREEKAREKEEKKREFMERQARRRARAREMDTVMEEEKTNDHPDHNNNNIDVDGDCISSLQANPGEKRSRPAWSMTETEANNEYEYQVAEEEEDLMNFVENLDFEQYNNDMELRVLISQVKDRVRTLEKEKKTDELRLRNIADSELATARDEKYNSGTCFDTPATKNEPAHDSSEDDDLQSIAATIKSQGDESVGTIHSRKSLQMLVDKAKDRLVGKGERKGGGSTNNAQPLYTVKENKTYAGGETTMRPPVTITHIEDEGARLAETKSLNKLPFKNRNPAL